MGDEAEAYINRITSLPPIFAGYDGKPKTPSGKRQELRNEGYKQGQAATRGRLLMQFAKWLERSIDPCWIAHVAVEEFQCACSFSTDYDGDADPYTCEKWDNSTQEERATLFQNVYGYSHTVYLARERQEEERRSAELRRQFEVRERQSAEDARQRVIDAGVPPELMP